ncbi:MAG TPA: efflux RND transporter periplasmic adaptor subunit [Gemmatimonadaceae bacterium]|nr:efflux RND transporter periplasmic adaptor subunit [Gemmatimonadaceae bacterium]
MNIDHRRSLTLALALTLALGACAKDSSRDADASPVRGGPGGGAGGPSITLAANDVATVHRGTIEAGTPVTGNLNPIERVEVRARLEGDLVELYVREGERVRSGQLLARIENSEQESGAQSAEAARAAARAELSTAQWSLEQTEELFKAGAVPERDLKAAQQALSAAQAKVAAAEAGVRAASIELRDTYVRAPLDGIVESRAVEGGEHVSRGQPLVTVVRTNVLELAAAVPARLASDVAVGQPVRFAADGRRFEGRVARISPTVDPASRAVMVYVQIPNRDGAIRGGAFASGQIVGRTKQDALIVTSTAIRHGEEGKPPFAWRIESERLAQVPVAVGIVDEARGITEILDGLADGDRVIAGNVGTLGNGMRVEVLGVGGEDQKGAASGQQGARSPSAAPSAAGRGPRS